MDYTKLFYWLTVADNARVMFIVFTVIFTAVSLFSTFGYLVRKMEGEDEEDCKNIRKWMFWSYPFMILFWGLTIFTPSKRDALFIVGGGQVVNFLTTDSTTKQIPHELSNFIVSELKTMAKDAEVEYAAEETKERLVEKAKSLSSEELIEKMKTDSEYKKLLLEE